MQGLALLIDMAQEIVDIDPDDLQRDVAG